MALVALAVVTTACTSRARGEDETGTRVIDSRSLHAAISETVPYEFDLATFVIDGETGTTGERDRAFAFDSITKTVVGLVLARLDESGAVRLSTRVGSIFDAGRNGDLTLEQLASHSSGLPRLAPNADDWPGFDPLDPYAGYTAAMAEEGLRLAERGRSEYSNFGFQVLGLAIERATSRPLGALAADLVFEPAGMGSATLHQGPAALQDGLRRGRPTPHWSQLLGGAGAVTGTIDDLAAYAQLMLEPPPEVATAVATAMRPRAGDTGLGWVTTGGLTWHNGGSYGYSSLIVLDLERRRAAGYLAASGDLGRDSEDLLFGLLRHLRS